MSGFHVNGRACEATVRDCPLRETGEHFDGTAEEFAVWLVERDLEDSEPEVRTIDDPDFQAAVEMWMAGGAVDHLSESERVGLDDRLVKSGFESDLEQVQERFLAERMTVQTLTAELAEGVPDAEKRAVAYAASEAVREKWAGQMLSLHQQGYRITATSAERYGSDVLLIGWLSDKDRVTRGDLDVRCEALTSPYWHRWS